MVLNSNQIILGVNSGQVQAQNLIGSTIGLRAYWSLVLDVPNAWSTMSSSSSG